MAGLCVVWDPAHHRLEKATMDAVVNFNMNRFLDNEPGRVLLRTDLTEEQATRFIQAHAALLAARSQKALQEQQAREMQR